jgi:hypothetical protein
MADEFALGVSSTATFELPLLPESLSIPRPTASRQSRPPLCNNNQEKEKRTRALIDQ